MGDLTRKQVKDGLGYSIKDGAYTGAASGAVNTYLAPFALALGASAAQIGILTALPQLVSTLMQPFAGNVIEHAGSRKKISRTLLILSRIALVPVIGLAFFRGFDAFSVLLLFISISTALASFARIAWVSWMGDLVPEKIRGKYFGRRNMFTGIASLSATLVGGRLLGLTNTMEGFALIFSGAFILYVASLWYFSKVPEPELVIRKHRRHKVSLNVSEFLSSMKKTNFRHFMLYAVLFDFSVFLASPFFTVYVLEELKIGYWWFAVTTAASAISSIVAQKFWGKLADKYGDRNVMAVCSLFASMVPLLFVFSQNIPMLIFANAFSGFAWAGLDLVTFNFLLDSSPPLKRPLFISNYQFFDGLAVAAGSMAGSVLISAFGSGFLWFSGIASIFIIASLMRGACALFLIPRIKEERVKSGRSLPARDVIIMYAVSLYPSRGITQRVIQAHHCVKCWEEKAKNEMKTRISKMFSVV